MYFEELYQRLVEEARLRVRTGAITERGLAKECGVSQPHLHNVLKNIRTLSPGSASRLMQALDLNIPELLWQGALEDTGVRAVPMLKNPIGSGGAASLTAFAGFVPFPLSAVAGLKHPVAGRLGPDVVMPRAFSANDLVLLDQNPAGRACAGAESCWVVMENGSIRVRYVRMGGARVYVLNEFTLQERAKWNAVSLQDRNILEIVKARIVWVGRNMEPMSDYSLPTSS